MKFNLPINALNAIQTLRNWRTELSRQNIVTEEEIKLREYTTTLGVQAGTISDTIIYRCREHKKGAICFVSIRYTITTSSNADYVTFTLPYTAKSTRPDSTGNNQGVGLQIFTGSWISAMGRVVGLTNIMNVYKYDNSAISAGTVGVIGNFWYEIEL